MRLSWGPPRPWGAGINMGFSEALSETGERTGRGHPLARAAITGVVALIGGMMHTLPLLIPRLVVALPLACAVVGTELIVIAFIPDRYSNLNFRLSVLQVVGGGGLVFASSVLVGNS